MGIVLGMTQEEYDALLAEQEALQPTRQPGQMYLIPGADLAAIDSRLPDGVELGWVDEAGLSCFDDSLLQRLRDDGIDIDAIILDLKSTTVTAWLATLTPVSGTRSLPPLPQVRNSGDDATINANFATLVAQVNALLEDK